MLIKELWVEANWRNGFRDEKKEAEREETRGPGPRRERPAAGGTAVHEPGKLGPSPRGAGRQGRAAARDALPLWVGEESATGGWLPSGPAGEAGGRHPVDTGLFNCGETR